MTARGQRFTCALPAPAELRGGGVARRRAGGKRLDAATGVYYAPPGAHLKLYVYGCARRHLTGATPAARPLACSRGLARKGGTVHQSRRLLPGDLDQVQLWPGRSSPAADRRLYHRPKESDVRKLIVPLVTAAGASGIGTGARLPRLRPGPEPDGAAGAVRSRTPGGGRDRPSQLTPTARGERRAGEGHLGGGRPRAVPTGPC